MTDKEKRPPTAEPPPERRSGRDRRLGDRRKLPVPVLVERRKEQNRRQDRDRRDT
jgi:hypothetical protein